MSAPDPDKHLVLVVDDSPTVRRVVERTLEREGHSVIAAETGAQALEMAAVEPISLLLIDEVLLDMTGPELITALRAAPRTAEIPIVLTTSREDKDRWELDNDIRQLLKPFSPKDLVIMVESVLDRMLPGAVRLRLSGHDGEGLGFDAGDLEIDDASVSEFDSLVSEATDALSKDKGRSSKKNRPKIKSLQRPKPDDHRGKGKSRRKSERRRPGIDDISDQLDRLLKKHLDKRLPAVLKRSMVDVLRETGMVRGEGMTISGTIETLGLPEVLGFIETVTLTGRIAVLADDGLGEIWCENGQFVFATVSRPVAGSFLAKLLVDVAGDTIDQRGVREAIREAQITERRIGEVLLERELLTPIQLDQLLQHQALESFHSLLELTHGSYHFESTPLPKTFNDVRSRLPLRSVLMDGLRLLDEKHAAEAEFGDDDVTFVRLMSDDQVNESFSFAPGETELIDLIEGPTPLDELLDRSPMTALETKRVYARLERVGVIKGRREAA